MSTNIDNIILKEFMQEHKKEVVGIMDVLYDQDVILESYEHDLIQQGMQQGMQQGIAQVAKEMKQSKMPVEVIMEVTHLTKEEIDNL